MGRKYQNQPYFHHSGTFCWSDYGGISGIFLALPISAISKEILKGFDIFKTLSYLTEDGLAKNKDFLSGTLQQ